MEQPIYVKKKLVTVRCNNPFSYNKIPFVGICNRVVLDVDAISFALTRKAKVVEHLKNGKEVLLGFDNYNTYNGPTLIEDNTPSFAYSEPEIEMVDGMGNHTVINKKKDEAPRVVRHIDLEAIKAQQEEEEKKKKLLEQQRQKQEEQDRKAAELKAMKERDKKAREEAAAKILAQAKADKSTSVVIFRVLFLLLKLILLILIVRRIKRQTMTLKKIIKRNNTIIDSWAPQISSSLRRGLGLAGGKHSYKEL